MNFDFANPIIKKKKLLIIVAFTLFCMASTIILDFFESKFQGTSFYLSESFLFSLFWLLLLPFLIVQSYMISKNNSLKWIILSLLLPISLHLITYPAFIWFLSKLLYYHTFSYWQTFQFSVPNYFLKLSLVYSIPILFYTIVKNKIQPQKDSASEKLKSIIVSDGLKKTSIETKDILFFEANSPYITIHHTTKNFLHTTTLKSILDQLSDDFIRIHKSTIINLKHVDFYTSRLNGDYDVTMLDGSKLRISRTYASRFKLQFEKCHRVTTI